MKKRFYLEKDIAFRVCNFYEHSIRETVIVIYVLSRNDHCYGTVMEVLPSEAFYLNSEKACHLHGWFIKQTMHKCQEKNYIGFILFHNHLSRSLVGSLPSSDDRRMHSKIVDYLKCNKITLLFGTAIYSANRCTILFNNYKNVSSIWARKIMSVSKVI